MASEAELLMTEPGSGGFPGGKKSAQPTALVCINRRHSHHRSCAASGSLEVLDALTAGLAAAEIPVSVTAVRCFGFCQRGPIVRVAPGGRVFEQATTEMIGEIVDEARALLT